MIYQIAFLFLGLCTGSVFHEFGHMLCGRMVGIKTREFSIGKGPIIWRRKFGRTWYLLRRIPYNGYVIPENREWQYDRRGACFYLVGGVIGNCVLIGLAEAITAFPLEQYVISNVHAIVRVQLLMIVYNLWPWTRTIWDRQIDSDGRKLLRVWRKKSID